MNSAEAEFARQVDLAVKQQGGHGRFKTLIEKELLHYDILFAMENGGFLSQGLVFQGGTLLRLCYGNSRYSVDLDFCGGHDFSLAKFAGLKECIERFVRKRHGLEVYVKEPKESGRPSLSGKLNVFKWLVGVDTTPSRPDLRRQRIKLEIANVPAYTKRMLTLLPYYDILPNGYASYYVLAETAEEVLADKLIALPTCLPLVRYRDIWDIQWMVQRGVAAQPELVSQKVEDYQIADYREKLDLLIGQVADLATSAKFKENMRRLLPEDIYVSLVAGENADMYQREFMKKFLEEFRATL